MAQIPLSHLTVSLWTFISNPTRKRAALSRNSDLGWEYPPGSIGPLWVGCTEMPLSPGKQALVRLLSSTLDQGFPQTNRTSISGSSCRHLSEITLMCLSQDEPRAWAEKPCFLEGSLSRELTAALSRGLFFLPRL